MKKRVGILLLTVIIMFAVAFACTEKILKNIQQKSNAAAETIGEGMDAEECYEAGRAALYGLDGSEIDYYSSYYYFLKAMKLGKVEANFYMGLLKDWYAYPEQNFKAAIVYYKANSDNPYAQIAIAFLYKNGEGVEADDEKAKQIFQSMADNGCVEAYIGIAAYAYDEGDYETAFEDYNKVLEGTEQVYLCNAMDWIASMYCEGKGVEQDYDKALELFQKSADLGYANSIKNVGFMYENGYGTAQNYETAMEWYEKAADLKNDDAMCLIAEMYFNGYGVDQSYETAMEWYKKAVELENADAMTWLGYMYENGCGTSINYDTAMKWYKKAADLGDKTAMNRIGLMYQQGRGVDADYDEALEWYEKAAAAGSEIGNENAKYMRQKLGK